jgi:hypothetical protein
MTGLPSQLAPWADELAGFPPMVASLLGPWLPMLQRLVGPLAAPALHTRGEPDGYGDLSRRGSYERLVTSEWLLATEAPDEFLRRAAESEHLFLDRKQQGATGGLRTVVLFDTGPSQLGAPRLVHLAMLIILSRRARAARASFAWASCQRPGTDLDEGADAHAGQRLLAQRCLEGAGQVYIDAWAEMLATERAAECWAITGGPGRDAVRRGPHGWGYVCITEPLAVQRTHLEVEVQPPNAIPRKLRLELPRAEDQVRLLRDPWQLRAGVAASQGPLASGPALAFIPGSPRLVARLRSNVVVVHDLESRHSSSSPPFAIPAGRRLVAVGAKQRRKAIVTFGGDRLHIELSHRNRPWGPSACASDVIPEISGGERAFPLLPGPGLPFASTVLLGAATGELLVWNLVSGKVTTLELRHRGYSWAGDRVLACGRCPGEDFAGIFAVPFVGNALLLAKVGDEPPPGTETIFCHRGMSDSGLTLAAIPPASPSGDWRVFWGPGLSHSVILCVSGRRVLGGTWSWVAKRGTTWVGEPALVAIDHDQRTILSLGRPEIRTITQATDPIVDGCVSSAGDLVAYATRHQYAVVHQRGHVRLRQDLR